MKEAGLAARPRERKEGVSRSSEGCSAAELGSAPARPRPLGPGRGEPSPPPAAGAGWPSFGLAGEASRRRPRGPTSVAARTPGSGQNRSSVLETPPTKGVLTVHVKVLKRGPSRNSALCRGLGGAPAALRLGRLERRLRPRPLPAVEDLEEVLALAHLVGELHHLKA